MPRNNDETTRLYVFVLPVDSILSIDDERFLQNSIKIGITTNTRWS